MQARCHVDHVGTQAHMARDLAKSQNNAQMLLMRIFMLLLFKVTGGMKAVV